MVSCWSLVMTYAQCPPVITGGISYTGSVSFSAFASYIHLPDQASIDNFSTLYPDCSSVPGVLIGDPSSSSDITNLNGLSSLSDWGDVFIFRTSLTDLTGLVLNDNNLYLIGNTQISSLTGMSSSLDIQNFFCADNPVLASLGSQTFQSANFVQLIANAGLQNISGLNNLRKAALLQISRNDILPNLNGLNNLDSVDLNVQIASCDMLTQLTGLQSLAHIGGDLRIEQNPLLTDISAINSLTTIGGHLFIKQNDLLSNCDISLICDFLSEGYHAEISDNSGSCENHDSVLQECGVVLDCPYHLEISTQSELDSLLDIYPNCQKINGSLTISGSNFTHLDRLEQINHVGYKLIIENNPHLEDLTGLSQLIYLGESLVVDNNDQLQTLVGLDHVSGMRVVTITNNDLLNICNVPSLCNYLNHLPVNFSYWFNANNANCNGNDVRDQCLCTNSLSVTNGDGIYTTADSIYVSHATVDLYGRYNAPIVKIDPIFEVALGIILEIVNEGCEE